MSQASWILVTLGLIAAMVAVQFDDPRLEIGGAATCALFAYVMVAFGVRARVRP